jgi:hypothetical protein
MSWQITDVSQVFQKKKIARAEPEDATASSGAPRYHPQGGDGTRICSPSYINAPSILPDRLDGEASGHPYDLCRCCDLIKLVLAWVASVSCPAVGRTYKGLLSCNA